KPGADLTHYRLRRGPGMHCPPAGQIAAPGQSRQSSAGAGGDSHIAAAAGGGGNLVPALAAARLEHLHPTRRRHPGAKAMHLAALALLGLIGALHLASASLANRWPDVK